MQFSNSQGNAAAAKPLAPIAGLTEGEGEGSGEATEDLPKVRLI